MQYYGCFTHGCACLQAKAVKEENTKLLDQLQDKRKMVEEREKFIRLSGYIVKSIWECEFKKIDCIHLQRIKDSTTPQFYNANRGKVTQDMIIAAIRKDKIFGMCEVDCHVPDTLHDYFSEMSPIFCTTQVDNNLCGDYVSQHVSQDYLHKTSRLLVGGMAAQKLLLATPLLKWYIDNGIIITKIHQVIEFVGKTCFKSFQEKITQTRRLADDPQHAKGAQALSNMAKQCGNSAYGSLCLAKERQTKIEHVKGESELYKKTNSPMYKKHVALEKDIYEIESSKKKIVLDLPSYLAFHVLNYSKLHILRFYYEFLDFFY